MEKPKKSLTTISGLIASLQEKSDPKRLSAYLNLILKIQSSKKVVEIPNQGELYKFIKKELS